MADGYHRVTSDDRDHCHIIDDEVVHEEHMGN
jgi:hypothetical protein